MNRLFALSLLVVFYSVPAWAQSPELKWKHTPHPRLYLDAAHLAQLRSGLNTVYADIWPDVQKQADEIAATHPPAYTEHDPGGDALWWEMGVGSKLPYLALAYAVTRKKNYLDAAEEWTLASCSYPHWGTATRDGGDLAAGYMLLGVSVTYDWLYNDLDPATRDTLRRTLIERSRLMYEQNKKMYWRNEYLQNHLWVAMAGLAAGAFAVLDDPEASGEAAGWVNACLEKFRRTESLLGADGASHEGVTYWSLGIDGLQRFWALSGELLGEGPTNKWWTNTGYYRLYMSLPKNSWTPASKVIDFADGVGTDWVGPDYLLRRLGSINHDSHIEWLAKATAPVSVCSHFGACWLNPIWHDPTVPSQPESSLPTFRHFEDMGIVSSRSDWSGNESLLTFICGPALGHNATAKLDFDAGGEHTHPDANHFVLFGNGEFLIRDDGYRPKSTDLHNTLLVDGKGQIGEGGGGGGAGMVYGRPVQKGMWFAAIDQIHAKAHPRIIAARSSPEFDYVAADAAEAYPQESGVRRFVRQMVFLKPNILLVVDDVRTEGLHSLELRFHPQFPAAADPSGAYVSHGKKAVLRFEPLSTTDVQVVADFFPAKDYLTPAKTEGLDKLEDATKMFTIQLKTDKPSWRNAVALSWSAAGQEPPHVTLDNEGDSWIFQSGKRTIRVRWDGTIASLQP